MGTGVPCKKLSCEVCDAHHEVGHGHGVAEGEGVQGVPQVDEVAAFLGQGIRRGVDDEEVAGSEPHAPFGHTAGVRHSVAVHDDGVGAASLIVALVEVVFGCVGIESRIFPSVDGGIFLGRQDGGP